MAKQGPRKRPAALEVLERLNLDADQTICVSDSSSEDEDLLHPEDPHSSSDSDYCLPSSESDEDYEPLLASHSPSKTQPTRAGRWSPSVSQSPLHKKRKAAPTESEEEDRWRNRDVVDINPAPLRFKPSRTPGPTFDTTMILFAASSPTPNTCMPVFYSSGDSRIRKHCKRCKDAGQARIKTAVYCRKCNVPLCLTSTKNCFQLWHDAH